MWHSSCADFIELLKFVHVYLSFNFEVLGQYSFSFFFPFAPFFYFFVRLQSPVCLTFLYCSTFHRLYSFICLSVFFFFCLLFYMSSGTLTLFSVISAELITMPIQCFPYFRDCVRVLSFPRDSYFCVLLL